MSELKTVGSVPFNVETLSIEVIGAALKIRRADVSAITLLANNAENWKVSDRSIRQVSCADGGGNIFIGDVVCGGSISGGNISFGGRGGASMVVNGKKVEVSDGVLYCNGKAQKDDPVEDLVSRIARRIGGAKYSSRVSMNGIDIEIVDGVLFRNGVKQVDADGGSTEAKKQEPDVAEILVPHGYQGSLDLNHSGTEETVLVDGWKGGDADIDFSGTGSIKAEKPIAVESLALEQSGTGEVNLDQVDCRRFKADKSGTGALDIVRLTTVKLNIDHSGVGSIFIHAGSAESGMVEASGTSRVTMRGNFKSLRTDRSGIAKIDIG